MLHMCFTVKKFPYSGVSVVFWFLPCLTLYFLLPGFALPYCTVQPATELHTSFFGNCPCSVKWAPKSPHSDVKPREFKPLTQLKDHKSTPFLLSRKRHASKLMGRLSLPFQNAKKDSAECRKLLALKLWNAKLTAPPSYLKTQQQYQKDCLQLISSPINHLFLKPHRCCFPAQPQLNLSQQRFLLFLHGITSVPCMKPSIF